MSYKIQKDSARLKTSIKKMAAVWLIVAITFWIWLNFIGANLSLNFHVCTARTEGLSQQVLSKVLEMLSTVRQNISHISVAY